MLETLEETTLIPNAAHNSFYALCFGCEAVTTKTQEMYMIFSHHIQVKKNAFKNITSYEFLFMFKGP